MYLILNGIYWHVSRLSKNLNMACCLQSQFNFKSEIFQLFHGDNHHSTSSRSLISSNPNPSPPACSFRACSFLLQSLHPGEYTHHNLYNITICSLPVFYQFSSVPRELQERVYLSNNCAHWAPTLITFHPRLTRAKSMKGGDGHKAAP